MVGVKMVGVKMLRRLSPIVLAGLVLAVTVAAAPAHHAPLLRLDGIGPLKLGMSRVAAVKTGWLTHRGTGCQLGGRPYPITYRIDPAKAPAGVRGQVEFVHGKLSDMSFTRGVRTSVGVVVGKTTVARMVSRYRGAGFTAASRYLRTFAGTFVTVMRKGKMVLGGFAAKQTITLLSIPTIVACE